MRWSGGREKPSSLGDLLGRFIVFWSNPERFRGSLRFLIAACTHLRVPQGRGYS